MSADSEGDGEDDHTRIEAYLGSSEWETLLEEAQRRRAAVLAERAERTGPRDAAPGAGSRPAVPLPWTVGPRPDAPDPEGTAPGAAARGTAIPGAARVAVPVPRAAPAAARRLLAGSVAAALMLLSGVLGYAAGTAGDAADPAVDAAPAEPGPVDAGPAAASAPMPDLSGLRIVLHAPSLQAAASGPIGRAEVRSLQVSVTPFATEETSVAFYHPADREAAESLAAALGGAALDLIGMTPAPAARTLTVHLSGAGGSSGTAANDSTTATSPGASSASGSASTAASSSPGRNAATSEASPASEP